MQGVGFRYFVSSEAHKLGIAGWVRNNMNGTVEALAAGSREQLTHFHESLRRGPRANELFFVYDQDTIKAVVETFLAERRIPNP